MIPEVEYLLSLQAVRERAAVVLAAAECGSLTHFDYHPEQMDKVADHVVSVIERDFGPDKFDQIPPHGRWQHFNVGNVPRVEACIEGWRGAGDDDMEITRRLIDLFFVSVLLDAGAGDIWTFAEPVTSKSYTRSEGIAVASLYMFKTGTFAGDAEQSGSCVTGNGLKSLNAKALSQGFQISSDNPMIGVDARSSLLSRVGDSLLQLPELFGPKGRPGNLVDYLVQSSDVSEPLDYAVLWMTLQRLLLPSWPSDRPSIQGTPIGDAWPLKTLANRTGSSTLTGIECIQPFHKLTQWLAYSLAVPFQRMLGRSWKNMTLGTGLPEYRNGGLFTDMGVLTLKKEAMDRGFEISGSNLPMFAASSDEIVEWRAMTVALLDQLHVAISAKYETQGVTLSMAQMLEAGTWKSGRELAAKYRPLTKSSPILIAGDGTLF